MVILAALFCLFFALFLRPINWITVNEEIKKSSVTPLSDYLFKIRENIDAAQLPGELAVIFHHTVTQLNIVFVPACATGHSNSSFLLYKTC